MTAPTCSWRSGSCGRACRRLIPSRVPGNCERRWRCGAGGRWRTWPAWPGWKNRPSSWTCFAERVQRALSEARLAAGEHAQLVPDLEQMVADHPLDEQIHAQLMLALYRSGRQADALAAYQRLRRTLDEELGIDPSQALRDLEAAILRQDPSLDAPAPAVALLPASCPAAPVPAQLPPAVAGFAGRDAELAGLDAVLPQAARSGTPGAPPPSSRRSRAPPGWARPRWPCTGRTGCASSSPTGSCTSTCAGSTGAGRRWIRARRCAGSWTRSRCRRSGSPTAWTPRRALPQPARWQAGAGGAGQRARRRARCARCCPARPDAWPWSPAATTSPAWWPRKAPSRWPWTC